MSVYIYYDAPQDISWNYTLSGSNASIGTGGGFAWQYPGNATTDGTDLSGAITIPSTITDGGVTYNVTGIDQYAFSNCSSLTSIDLGNSVETIGSYAFQYCSSLTSIHIPDSVTTIGQYAFYICTGLTSIDLGNSVTTIGSNAFDQCTSLTSITIPDSVETIGSNAFQHCFNLHSIDLGNSVETIGEGAFSNCTSLTSIDIPDSVTTIGQDAFFRCPNTSITIPDSVTTIGERAFASHYIMTSGSPSTVYVKNVDPTKTMIEGLEYIGGHGKNEASDGGLMDGKISGTVAYVSLTSTPIAPSLSNVSFAYDGTTKYSATISSMDLEGDNLTFSLSGKEATSFQIDACNNALLESVNPWDLNAPFAYSFTIKATDSTDLSAISLVSIAKTATADDLSTNNISGSTLKTLADQSSVSPKDLYDVGYTVDQLVAAGFSYWNYTLSGSNASIGDGTGNYGSATTLGTSLSGAITIPSTIDGYTVTSISQNAFYDCRSLTSITIPDSVTTIGVDAFFQCFSLASVTLPTNPLFTSIDHGTFIYCRSLTSITIPDSVTTIDQRAFYLCTSLTSVTLPANPLFTTIGPDAFDQCTSLETIDLPNSVTTIGLNAFRSSGLTSIHIPDSVTNIGSSAFERCSNLSSIDLGNSVTTIGYYAFQACSNLTSITIPDLVTTIAPYAFSQCTSLTSIDLGNSVTTIDQRAFYLCTSLTSIDLGNSVETIGQYAFDQCTSLETIDLPNSVTTIGLNAFRSSGLTSIIIPDSVTTIGSTAFYRCSSLTSIHIPDSVTAIVNGTFKECGLTSITIPDSVTSIGQEAFFQCTSLTSIDLGNSVTTIGLNAFTYSGLTSITIPDSVTTIGSSAFVNIGSSPIVYVKDVDPTDAHTMTTLESTMFGKIYPSNGTVTYTQWVAPNYAPNTPTLSDISCNENTPYNATVSATDDNGDALTFSLSGADAADFTLSGTDLSANAVFDFETKASYNITITASDGSLNTSADFTITVNNVVETASDLYNANVQGSELKTNADGEGITSQQLLDAGYTFEQLLAAGFLWNYTLDSSNNATIGDGTTSYGNATTLGTSLSGAITIPSTIDGYTVIGIGYSAFRNCTSLTSIDFSGAQVTTIGTLAFRSSGLTSIDIPDSVTTIGSGAFYQCSSLTSITIPDSVTTIGSLAFSIIGLSSTVFVKNVDPTDDYTMATLETKMTDNITGVVTYLDFDTPHTVTLSDISCNENTPYTATVSAIDNNGDSLTFDLSGADYADFTLTGTDLSGNAVLSAKAVFDYETDASYNITITASDGTYSRSADFTITVNNVVETASDLYNANVQGSELKTNADGEGITSQQLLDAGYTVDNLIAAGICFPAGTPVNTDQGTVAIDKIDVSKHTIRGKRIVAITQTITHEKHIVCIKKDAFAKNVPCQDTLTTQNHCFFYNGNMVKAKHLVNKLDNVVLVKYDGCILYNVLQDKHETMVINNLIAETFYPEHGIAKMYRYFSENKVSPEMQYNIMVQVANEYKKKNLTK